ncbi:hypothetical protein [Amycolatopsis magusensis]
MSDHTLPSALAEIVTSHGHDVRVFNAFAFIAHLSPILGYNR